VFKNVFIDIIIILEINSIIKMDEERNKKIDEIEATLKDIKNILIRTRWEMFVEGLWKAVGYLVGLTLAMIIAGWVLNMIGVIPFMSEFSENMKGVLNVVRSK
jgi:hypothetical protein